ncbi:hypothetical protein AJ79_06204 [Helicocarpus griseus UAMH5409]|uniref:Uncharacterized protein n=1 Tax=Helicocarpus griseus UAMH5409 TaxID=1447875 RepID=A0A2B7XGE0_9EURO|nr:hypothetical protein AJ79_06204 [Helicocarpus griseus UAMH5409]
MGGITDTITTPTSTTNPDLPSPWTNYAPPLRNPFHPANNNNTSSSSRSTATSSPFCSPDSSPTNTSRRHRFSTSLNRMRNRSRSGSPFTMRSATSSLRISSLLLRRRPSAVDLALSEERCRCSEDSIEKIGLGLMEPRPVDPMPMPMPMPLVVGDMGMGMDARVLDFELEGVGNGVGIGTSDYIDSLRIGSRPRFVMGGIREVMEGTA